MSDDSEPVGSLGEEAAKLLGAIQDWARENGSDQAGAAAGFLSSASAMLGSVNEHIATGGAECRYCPICQLISAVRGTSPELKAHLTAAGLSLVQALEELLAARATAARPRTGPVERIDLADEDEWGEDWD